MNKTYYQNRWIENSSNSEALQKISKVTQKGGALKKEHSPFGVLENGLIDFRGLRFSDFFIKKLKIKDADISFSDFYGATIKKSSLSNVKCEQVDFSEVRGFGNSFKEISFTKCKFIGASLGYNGSRYVCCDIDECNFKKAIFTRPEFTNTNFINCKLDGMDFFGSSFEECSFKGKYKDIWFRGGYAHPSSSKDFGKAKKNTMKNVSFEEAEISDFTFSNNCDLSSVKLPNVGNYVFFDSWKKRLEYLDVNLDQWAENEKKEAKIFVKSYLGHAKNQPNYIINIDFLKKEFDEYLMEKIIYELENTVINV